MERHAGSRPVRGILRQRVRIHGRGTQSRPTRRRLGAAHHGDRARKTRREPRMGARVAHRLEIDALRTQALGVPHGRRAPGRPECRGRAARSGACVRHRHASHHGALSADFGFVARRGPQRDRLRLRLRHLRCCRLEAGRRPRVRGRSGPPGAARNARQRDSKRRFLEHRRAGHRSRLEAGVLCHGQYSCGPVDRDDWCCIYARRGA